MGKNRAKKGGLDKDPAPFINSIPIKNHFPSETDTKIPARYAFGITALDKYFT